MVLSQVITQKQSPRQICGISRLACRTPVGGGGGAEDIQRDQPSATPIVQDAKVLDNSEEMTREAQPKNRKR